ncbi:M23 family metallopeptidase [Paenibacillaceae bacterium]|nr:M23 family metallopeptidase [Paenibacillaceae bacterium]
MNVPAHAADQPKRVGETVMNIKDGVKQRRQERMKQISQQQSAALADRPVKSKASNPSADIELGGLQEDLGSGILSFAGDSRPELDPEEVWHLQPKPWQGWSQPNSGTQGGGSNFRDEEPNWRMTRRDIKWKLAASALIFAAVWGMFRLDMPWAKEGQRLVTDALTEEMNFTAVAVWYNDHFAGSPAFIPIFGEQEQTAQRVVGAIKPPAYMPVESGRIVRTFAELHDGIEIAAASGAVVRNIDTGRVLELVKEPGSGTTVILQHANGRQTIYGKVDAISVQPDDWVEAGTEIGKVAVHDGTETGLLFFAMKDQGRFINPTDVIAFD